MTFNIKYKIIQIIDCVQFYSFTNNRNLKIELKYIYFFSDDHHFTIQVLGVWHGRTVIRSSYKLSYEVAQDILDGKTETEMKNEIAELAMFSGDVLAKKFSKLKETLELLSRVAKVIQTKREKEGALRLESAEVTFEFQRSSLEDIKPKQHLAVHETVAECMIFANQWVAKKISK